MKKRKVFGCVIVLTLALILGFSGAALLYGQSYNEQQRIQENEQSVFNAYSAINTYGDTYITYNQFAKMMQNLLGYVIGEKYTFNSGDMNIRYHEARSLIFSALGRSDQSSVFVRESYFTAAQFAAILDSLVQAYITDENEDVISLAGAYLQGDVVISAEHPNFDMVVTNIEGTGNIVVASGHSGRILFNNVNIRGNIIIAGADGFVDITLNNSNVDSVIFNAAGRINVLTMNSTARPNVVINTTGVHLAGDFSKVESNLHDGIIFIDGNIGGLYAIGNVILVGAGSVEYIVAPDGAVVEIFDPNSSTCAAQGITDELIAILDDLFSRHLGRLEFNLLDNFWYMLDNLRFPEIRFPSIPAPQIIQLPPLPQATPSPSPSPSPSPGPDTPILTPPPSPSPGPNGSNGGNGQAVGDPIDTVSFNILPPNRLPSELLPAFHPNDNVQRDFVGNGFRGEIEWIDVVSNNPLPLGGAFTPDGIYRAVITLTPDAGKRFTQNNIADLQISRADNLGIDSPNWLADSFAHDEIVINLLFGRVDQWPADEFTLRSIKGPFHRIYVDTHYLGTLNASHFEVRFGYEPIIDNPPLVIERVDEHFNNSIGHYVIVLANEQRPTGTQVLEVRMIDPLPFHMAYAEPATTTPEFDPTLDDTPVVLTLEAAIGGNVDIRNFPIRDDQFVYLSPVPLRTHEELLDRMFGYFDVARVMAFVPSASQRNSFIVPGDAALGRNYVHIVDTSASSSPPTVTPVGSFTVLPPITGVGEYLE